MTKKEYFASDLCSQKSKKLIKAGWIVFGICSGLSALGAVITAVAAAILFSKVDFSRFVDYVLEHLQGFDGMTYNSLMEELEELESIFGISAQSFLEIAVTVSVVLSAALWLTVVTLSFFAAYKRNLAVAIVSVVFASFTGSLLLMGSAITLLVFVCILNKEYKTYCEDNGIAK